MLKVLFSQMLKRGRVDFEHWGDLFFSLCLLPGLYFWSMQNNVSGLAVFIPWFFSAHFALASCFTNCPMDFA